MTSNLNAILANHKTATIRASVRVNQGANERATMAMRPLDVQQSITKNNSSVPLISR